MQHIENDEKRKERMLSARKILTISPHPDDSEIIAGGYLFQAVKKGAKVRILVVTDGSKGTRKKYENLAMVRKMEQLEAAAILGIGDVSFLGIEDTRTPQPREMVDILLPEIREFSPDLVITNDPFLSYESHLDHINTGLGVLQSIIFYEFPNIGSGEVNSRAPDVAVAFSDSPNVFIGIDDEYRIKIDALREHRSQNIDLSWIEKICSYYGNFSKTRYGEAFRFLYPDELHLNIFHQ
ncbi:MAG: PIG-L family deacetylase [Thermoplasmata archaeon]|jgi:LmbE family N-acetylglucosaminyl deacetylase|nr:PIG-L family deacetylase [Thermoplasmata archaeon]